MENNTTITITDENGKTIKFVVNKPINEVINFISNMENNIVSIGTQKDNAIRINMDKIKEFKILKK